MAKILSASSSRADWEASESSFGETSNQEGNEELSEFLDLSDSLLIPRHLGELRGGEEGH